MDWSCEFCGKDTSNVDYDYLDGRNHLACILGVWGGNDAINKNKTMKIKNWDKIFGITYKGFSIVNPMHDANETKYFADVLNLNIFHKPKIELEFTTTKTFGILKLIDGTYTQQVHLSKHHIKTLKSFITEFESLIDVYIDYKEQMESKIQTASSHSLNNGGIIANVMNSGTTIKI